MRIMGKVLVSLSLVFLLTGCGKEKQLECSISNELNGVETKQNYTLNFDKKDKFNSAALKIEMKLKKEQTNNLSTYKKQLEDTYKDSKYKDLNPKVSDNGKDTVIVTVDLTKEEVSKMASADSSKVTSKMFKEDMEKQGYTCK